MSSISFIELKANPLRIACRIPDLDAETLADTLEGITDLREMLAELIRSALEDEALAEGLSTRLNDMKARFERLETLERSDERRLRNAKRGESILAENFTGVYGLNGRMTLTHGCGSSVIVQIVNINRIGTVVGKRVVQTSVASTGRISE